GQTPNQMHRRRINFLKRIQLAVILAVSVCAAFLSIAAAESARKTAPGNAPGDVPQVAFFVHRLGTDHAEGITTLDMSGDGRPDLLSGAYWYENPGPAGGEWKRHQ